VTSAYPFLLAAGVLISLIWLAASGPARQRTASIDAAISALAGGLVGARAVYIAANVHLYVQRPWETLYFWEGGLAWVGGAAGAIVGLAAYARAAGKPFWALADAMALPAGVIASAGWAGCWAEACAYGRRANAGWLTPASPDLFGLAAPRWPTQALGLACGLAIVGLLAWLSHRRLAPGAPASLGLALIAAAALAISFLRGDPVPGIFGLRSEALGAAVILALAGLSLAWRMRRGGTV
jgi:phosphatidylglycerol:prolipoprotein diacylglycerol transferase